jgi:hypothetical protein
MPSSHHQCSHLCRQSRFCLVCLESVDSRQRPAIVVLVQARAPRPLWYHLKRRKRLRRVDRLHQSALEPKSPRFRQLVWVQSCLRILPRRNMAHCPGRQGEPQGPGRSGMDHWRKQIQKRRRADVQVCGPISRRLRPRYRNRVGRGLWACFGLSLRTVNGVFRNSLNV